MQKVNWSGVIFFLFISVWGCRQVEDQEKLVSTSPPTAEDYKEQISFLTKEIEKNPNSDHLYYLRALANTKVARLRAARRDIEDAIKINRHKPKYHYQRALIENRFNQTQEALNAALTAQEAGFDHPDLLALLGELYFKASNFSQAKKYLLQCENNAYYSDSLTLLYLAYIFKHEKDTASARKRLEPLLEKYPGCAPASNLLMQFHISKAQSRKAVDVYMKADKIKATSPSMTTTLAKAYSRLQKQDSALYYFQKAFDADSTQWEAALALKDQKISEKNLKKAVQYYETALRQNPTYPKGFSDLGYIYEYYFFEFEKAKNCYLKGSKYFPEDKKLEQSLQRIEAKIKKGRNFFVNPQKNPSDSLKIK
jgi:tetratricopeptide (TPR) repeat protein